MKVYRSVHVSPIEPGVSGVVRTWHATPRSLLPEGWAIGPGISCEVDGHLVDDWDAPMRDGAVVVYRIMPQGFGLVGPLADTILGAKTLLGFAGILGVNFALTKLLGPPKKQTAPLEADPSYSFAPATNNDLVGAPVPVAYGTSRVAGDIIGEYKVTQTDPPQTFLYLLMLMSHGPIHAIGDKTSDGGPYYNEHPTGDFLPEGLQINGQDASNYSGVEAYVRLGGLFQSAIPGFENTRSEYYVGQSLLESEDPGPGSVEIAAGTYPQGDAELDKWDTALTYTASASDSADEFTVRVVFPQGLYGIDTGSGALVNNSAQFQIRYIEVNSGGTPTGDYVVLPPEPAANLKVQAESYVEYTHTFIDPSTYTAPGSSYYLDLDGSSNAATVSTPTDIDFIEPASVEMSVALWVKFDESLAATGNFDDSDYYYFVNQGITSTGSTGFQFRIRYWAIGANQAALEVVLGDGSVTNEWTSGQPGGAAVSLHERFTDGDWHHVAFTYKANVDDQGRGRVRYYFDGDRLEEDFTPASEQYIWAETDDILVGRRSASSPADECFDGGVDELLIGQAEWSEFQVKALWNNGVGFPASSSYPGLIGGWHLDSGAGTTADFSSNGNAMTLGSGASITSGVDYGPVLGAAGGTAKAGLYKIEVQRIDASDVDANLAEDAAVWNEVVFTQYQTFIYPGSALLAVKILATDQISGSRPTVSCPVSGRLVPVWDGNSETLPVAINTFSRNPAWIALDMATNAEYGAGNTYVLADARLASIKVFADWCDHLVYDGIAEFDLGNGSSFYDAGNNQVHLFVPTDGATKPPDHWVVGYRLILTGASDSDYETPMLAADPGGHWDPMTIVSITDSGGVLNNRLYVCSWPETLDAPTNASPVGLTGTLKGLHERMQYDAVLRSKGETFIAAITSVLQTARAAPVFRGSEFDIFFDRPRDPVAIAGMGNIVPGSFEQTFSDISARENAVEVEYWDEDRAYERDVYYDEHPDATDPDGGQSLITGRISLRGVTRRGQVARHARYYLNVQKLVRRECRFKVAVERLAWEAGDVVPVAHDVPQWGYSGRVQSASSTTAVALDREVVIEGGSTYELQITRALDGTSETKAVSSSAGTYAAGTELTTAAFSLVPQRGDSYSFGKTSLTTKAFAVTTLPLDARTLEQSVEAVEYNEGVYSDDFGTLAPAEVSDLPVPSAGGQLGASIPANVVGLTVTSGMETQPDGSAIMLIRVSWGFAVGQADSVGSVAVWLGDSEAKGNVEVASLSGPQRSCEFSSAGIRKGQSYMVTVQPIATGGARQALAWCARGRVTPKGWTRPPAAPAALTAALVGERAVYRWSHAAPSNPRTMELRRGGWILGDTVLSVPGGYAQYETANWAGSSLFTPELQLRAISGGGQVSAASSLSTFSPSAIAMTNDESLYDTAEAPSWSGTKTELSAHADGYLEFGASSALVGTYEFSITSLASPVWGYLQVLWDAEQVDPLTLADATFTLDSDEAERRTFEGPLWSDSGDEQCSMRVQVRHSPRSSVSSSMEWQDYSPGRVRLRAADVLVTITRPDSSYDVKLTNLAVKISRVPARRPDVLQQEALGL